MPDPVDVATARRVAMAGVLASVALAALNLTVGWQSGSTAVFATGVEFAGDVLASSIVVLAVAAAARPADDDHPYGHGRVETLAAFAVGLVLLAGGVGLSVTSLQNVGAVRGAPAAMALWALVAAIMVRGGMAGLKFRIGRRLRSAALMADAWNDAVDILAAAAALTAVALARYDVSRFRAADHYGGAVVGVVVIVTGLRVLRDASLELIDTMPDAALLGRLKAVALAVPGVRGVDKAHARKTGMQYHVDLHVEVAPDLTVAAAHAIGGHVRHRLRAELDWVADVLVHIEPTASPAADQEASRS